MVLYFNNHNNCHLKGVNYCLFIFSVNYYHEIINNILEMFYMFNNVLSHKLLSMDFVSLYFTKSLKY